MRLPAMPARDLRRVISILGKAWGERVKLIRVINVTGPTTWTVTGVRPQPVSIVLGLTIDPTKAVKMVEIGPAADDQVQAEQFREFWGDKAEIRRFKDGTIAMCTGTPRSAV
jgi:U3 small nucleolar RNA-associated protein 22